MPGVRAAEATFAEYNKCQFKQWIPNSRTFTHTERAHTHTRTDVTQNSAWLVNKTTYTCANIWPRTRTCNGKIKRVYATAASKLMGRSFCTLFVPTWSGIRNEVVHRDALWRPLPWRGKQFDELSNICLWRKYWSYDKLQRPHFSYMTSTRIEQYLLVCIKIELFYSFPWK